MSAVVGAARTDDSHCYTDECSAEGVTRSDDFEEGVEGWTTESIGDD